MTESEKIYRLLASIDRLLASIDRRLSRLERQAEADNAREADNGRLRYKLTELNNYYKNN
jgi:hypothetical protein